MNISSVVILTKASNIEKVIQIINNSDFCEYHLHDEKGRIVVTIEGDNVGEETGKLKQIQSIPEVISAEMVYSYSEDELDKLKDNLENSDGIPNWLNDDNIKAENIVYNGDLKKRF